MKKILATLALCMLAIGSMAQNNYKINGNISCAADGEKMMLITVENNRPIFLDSAEIKTGKFVLQGSTEGISDVIVAYPDRKSGSFQPKSMTYVIVSPGANINLEMGCSSQSPYKVWGDKNNEIVTAVQQYEEAVALKNRDLIRGMQDTTLDIFTRYIYKQKIDSVQNVLNENRAQTIINNMPNPISSYLLGSWINALSPEQTNHVLDAMATKMPNDPLYKLIMENRRAAAEIEAATEIGKPFLEIALVDTKGNMRRLSEVVKANKITILDFWASWCRPCLAEMPNVKKIYAEYHSKGLEIYGVSLDENQIQWQAAIERLQMPWIHVSDLKGWQSAGAKTYNIKAIPATIIIGENGKIIAKNLRGAALRALIEKELR